MLGWHSPPPEVQAIPGSILDEGWGNITIQGPHPYTPCKAKCIQYIIKRTEYKANNIGGLTTGAGMA